ncbi:hypothetical protein AAC387_Pa09g0222 [Persea americana]
MGDHPQITIQVHPTPPDGNFQAFTVRFFNHRRIRTTLTSNVDEVGRWVSMIWNRYSLLRNPLVVGFGVFRTQTFPPAPQGRAATIQICIDGFCLIWQLREVVPFGVPEIVQEFFLHPDVRLVGVDNGMHAPLLWEHHRIRANPLDLRYLAVERLGDFRLATESTMPVASAVFQFQVPETPFDVFFSNWEAPVLAPRQVLHAAVYAFVSYRIGMVLHAYD